MTSIYVDTNKPSKRALYLILPLSVFICYFSVGASLPVVSLFVHETLGMSSILVGIAVGIQFIATVSTRGYAGKLSDTKGAKDTALTGILACTFSGLFLMGADLLPINSTLKYLILLGGRLTLGFGESMMLTGMLSWGFGLLGAERNGLVMSWTGMAIYGGLAGGAPLGLLLYNQLGTASVGALISVLSLGIFIYQKVIDIKNTVVEKGELVPVSRVIGLILVPGIALFLQGVGFAVIGTFAILYFKEKGWENAGLALTFFGGAFVLMRFLFGGLPDRIGGAKVAIASFIIETSGLILIWSAPNSYTALAGAALTGGGCSLIYPSLGIIALKTVPSNKKGTAIGLFSAFQDLSYAFTGPLTGALAAFFAGYSSVYASAAAAVFTGLILTITVSAGHAKQPFTKGIR
jgi:MFS family permease